MSRLTRCNRCTLDAIERRAQADGMAVTVHEGNVFVHPHGHELDLSTDPETGNHRSPYWTCWLMEISEQCCC